MEWIALNISLSPSEEIRDICEKIYSQDASEYFSENLPYFPHITLFQKAISLENLEKLMQDLECLHIPKFELEMWNFTSSTLFCWQVKRNKDVTELQKTIIALAGKYPDAKRKMKKYSREKEMYLWCCVHLSDGKLLFCSKKNSRI